MPTKTDQLVMMAAGTAAIGPLFGDYLTIFCFAVAGGLIALSRISTQNEQVPLTLKNSMMFFAASVSFAMGCSWIAARILHEQYPAFSMTELLSPVSMLIAVFARPILVELPALAKSLWPFKRAQ